MIYDERVSEGFRQWVLDNIGEILCHCKRIIVYENSPMYQDYIAVYEYTTEYGWRISFHHYRYGNEVTRKLPIEDESMEQLLVEYATDQEDIPRKIILIGGRS